jgi:hypothetical protein
MNLFSNLKAKFRKARFNWLCRGILDTDPLQHRNAPLRIISLVQSDDRIMYLLAIKSLYRYLPGGEIIIIDDGSLTDGDRDLFRRHLGAPSFVPLHMIQTGNCPKGGCWERLLHLLDLTQESYVIQMDSDMLTTGPVPEVVEAIKNNQAFTLNTGSDQKIVDLEDAAAYARGMNSQHVQVMAERSLPTLPSSLGRRYVRGSAGFTGFAHGGVTRQDAEAFSAAMQSILGNRWTEWGTEQVTSNYLVANSPNGVALDWPKYACLFPDVDPTSASMLHFPGSWRWNRDIYVRLGRQVIHELKQPLQEQRPVMGGALR